MINCVCGRSVLKKNWKRHATLGKRNQCKLFYLKQQDGKSLTVADQVEIATAPLKDEIKKLKESITKMKRDFNKIKNYVEQKVGSKEAEKHALEIQKKLEVDPPNTRDCLIELTTFRDETWLRECCQLASKETEFVENLWWFHYLKRFCDSNGGVFWKIVCGKDKEIISIEVAGKQYAPRNLYHKVFENFRRLSTVVYQKTFNQRPRDENLFTQLTHTCNTCTFEFTQNGKWPDAYAPCPLEVVPDIELEYAFQKLYDEAVEEKRSEVYHQLRELGEID